MSANNPTKGVAALLPVAIDVGGGYAVKPLSLGVYAILERIKSPLLDTAATPDTLELVPSLYALTHDPCDVLSGALFDKAMAWADTVDPGMLVRIRDAATRQIGAMTAVLSGGDDDGSKKNHTTAGSSPSPSGRLQPTAGATTKSSGKPRQAPSPRSGVSGSSHRATTRHSR